MVEASSPDSPQEWVWLARIRRPQGRKGEVLADILTDFPEKFAERKRLWLVRDVAPVALSRHRKGSSPAASAGDSAREIQLTNHWLHKGAIVLHFAGVDSISDAEALAGWIVAVPWTERTPLAEDEFYIGDLIGCVLVDVARADAGAFVGEIENVEREAGPVPLLIVRSARGETLIPFAKSYLRKIDTHAKRVEMALPDGLLDLNTPERA